MAPIINIAAHSPEWYYKPYEHVDGAAAFRVIDLSGNQYKTNILATCDGTFYARKVKVNLNTNWADFVFDDECEKSCSHCIPNFRMR